MDILGISSHLLFYRIYIIQSQHPMWRLGCFTYFELAIMLQSTDNFRYQLGTRIIWRWNLRLVLSQSKMAQIPVDTLLYIAVTRATWGLSVVEPFPRRFAAHYQIGVEGRSLSRAAD